MLKSCFMCHLFLHMLSAGPCSQELKKSEELRSSHTFPQGVSNAFLDALVLNSFRLQQVCAGQLDCVTLWCSYLYPHKCMWRQASQKLGPAWTLMRGGTPGCPDIPDWLAGNVPEGGRVGIDPFVHTVCPPECCLLLYLQ